MSTEICGWNSVGYRRREILAEIAADNRLFALFQRNARLQERWDL